MDSSDYRTVKLFMAALIGVGVLIIFFLTVTGNFGTASQLLQEAYYKGTGTIDVDILGEDQNSRMMAQNSEGVDISYTKTESPTTKLLKVNYELDKGDGSRRTKFIYQAEGASAGGNIFVDKINGSFSGSAISTITVGDDGTVSFDLVTEATGEDISFHATFYDIASNGKPTSGERLSGVGNWTIWRHINKTEITTSEDWLKFCIELNRDMILDSTVPDGVYIIPEGYYLNDDQQLVKVPEGYTLVDGKLAKFI